MTNRTTPGPWALRGYQIRADNGRGAHVASYQICRADGALLAAAPDLLRALEQLLACQPSPMAPFGRLYEACENARAALLKARENIADPAADPECRCNPATAVNGKCAKCGGAVSG